ncbi:MAG TPA: glutamine-hydrolyzing carbamoyl-phosphate synthase small subunit [Alphaproteobacteria bacterium]|nr:glutamine-hydrolyzing carbamoyl-phosphate synthase small subunit [Alphaproteobacteria bacterium]
MSQSSNTKPLAHATGALILSDGTIIYGTGFGAEGAAVGEICFNTGLTGYQETLTDPSYAAQIITFTFPHIGNVGANDEDLESDTPAARGLVVREVPTSPSNWRMEGGFDSWLKSKNLIGLAGIDTRALTQLIRDKGAPNGIIAHNAKGEFDIEALKKQAAAWPGLEGMDLAKDVTCKKAYDWSEPRWQQDTPSGKRPKVVAIDYGAKRNILRCLVSAGCDVTVLPATASANDILAHKPEGVFLSNGPGDPAATGVYAIPAIQAVMKENIPIFGICLGHQLLALSLGGKTRKMKLGHRGANQPVKDLETGKVEITSQNHGFEVVEESLPAGVKVTHQSLFDGSNEGIRVEGRPFFSVQYHPEASPGPMDSLYLFERFVEAMKKTKAKAA